MKDWLKKSYKTIATISLFFFLTLGGITLNGYYHHKKIERNILDSDRTTATVLQNLITEHQRAALALLKSYATRPPLVNSVKERNEEQLLFDFAQLKSSNQEIDWVFLTDKNGVLLANYPVDKIVYGKDLSYRDWYKGVSKEWTPYISALFKLIVGNKELGVALSVPVFDQEGQVIGILANTQRVSFLRTIIQHVPFDQYAKVTLIDQMGQMIYSNTFPLEKEVHLYPFYTLIKKAALENNDISRIDTGSGNRKKYVTIASLKEFGWTIIVERTRQDIFLSNLSYYVQTAVTGILLLMFFVIYFFYLRGKILKVALQRAHNELEQRVAERTCELVRVNDELEKDIAKRKQIEERIEIQKRLLDRSQEIAHLGSWHLDIKKNTITWSDEQYRIFCQNPDEFEATYEAFIDTVHPDDREMVNRTYTFAIKNNQPYECIHRILRNDGEVRVVLEKSEDIVDEKGDTIHSFGFTQDIAELKKAEKELLSSMKEKEEANTELKQFSYVIAHDLKAPLRAISNYSFFLQKDLADSLTGTQKEYLERLKDAAVDAGSMVEDLLLLARIGIVNIEQKPVDLRELLKNIVHSLDKGSDVQIDLADDWPMIDSDGIMLRQIFQNLIENGLKYNVSIVKRVEVACLPAADGGVACFVRDNGIGIDAQYHEQIFRMFERLHASKEYSGSGVGLALVKRAVERLGGTIRLESTPGQGSTFYLSLPKTMAESLQTLKSTP